MMNFHLLFLVTMFIVAAVMDGVVESYFNFLVTHGNSKKKFEDEL